MEFQGLRRLHRPREREKESEIYMISTFYNKRGVLKYLNEEYNIHIFYIFVINRRQFLK